MPTPHQKFGVGEPVWIYNPITRDVIDATVDSIGQRSADHPITVTVKPDDDGRRRLPFTERRSGDFVKAGESQPLGSTIYPIHPSKIGLSDPLEPLSGDALRERRNHMSLSQSQLSFCLGYSSRQIGAWERGEDEIPKWVRYALIGLEQVLATK